MILTTSLVGCFLTIVSAGECLRKYDVLLCEDSVPNNVQDGVITVKIFNVDLNVYFHKKVFQHKSWRHVEHLVLRPDINGYNYSHVQDRPSFVLPSTFSDYLYNLVELSVTSKNLIGLHKGAFHIMTKLEVLDFPGNVEVTLTDFTAALLGNSMNNLKRLNISRISVRTPEIRWFGSDFFNCFRNSQLEELDLSKIDSVINPEIFYDAFPFLQSLNIEDSGSLFSNLLRAMYLNPNGSSFKFLKKLNVNNAFFPDSFMDVKLLILGESDLSVTPQINLTHIWARKIVLSGLESVPYLVNLGNKAVLGLSYPDLNINRSMVALPLDNTGGTPLQVLDLSHNRIKSLEPSYTETSMIKHFEDIDLSNNRLYLMKCSKFKYLLKGATNLYRINLSNNRLSKLHLELCRTNTKLEYIYLSHNKLSTLAFKFTHLKKMKVLDVSFNEIHYFEDTVLSNIYDFLQSVLVYRAEFTIKLGGNPLECSCKSKEFMEWIIDPRFSNYIQPSNFECLESKYQTSVTIDKNAWADAVFQCKLPMIIGVGSALSAVVVIILGIFVLLLCRRYLASRLDRKLALYIAKRNEDRADKLTPIFLSYCSENVEFVSNVIYPSLNSSLQKILKTDRRCIATGDLDFRPGIHVSEGIVTCIETCSVFAACVSKAFCKKAWCKNEVQTAINEHRPVILIFLEAFPCHHACYVE